VLNRTFTELKLEKHPDKTDMGRIEKGFDFLGYHFSPHGLTLADKTVENFLEKARRINARKSPGSGKGELSDYVKRWCCWAYGGLAPLPNGRECRSHQEAPEATKDIPHVPLRIQPSGFMSKNRSNDFWRGLEGAWRCRSSVCMEYVHPSTGFWDRVYCYTSGNPRFWRINVQCTV
jgi:hypothetical protein